MSDLGRGRGLYLIVEPGVKALLRNGRATGIYQAKRRSSRTEVIGRATVAWFIDKVKASDAAAQRPCSGFSW